MAKKDTPTIPSELGDEPKGSTGASPTPSPDAVLEKGVEVRDRSEVGIGKLEDETGAALVAEGKELNQLELVKLSVDALIALEDKYPGILLYAFTDIVGATEKIDFSKWEFYRKPVAGQQLKVDFRGNHEANMQIGAADILPPAVRRITVYEQGDTALARTSERRCGLKGRNRGSESIGFFDKEGYIPIYTGDVVVVGGVQEPEKHVNLDYEKQFLTKGEEGKEVLDEASYARYEQSEEAKQDQAYLGKMFKENPYAARRKGVTEEDIRGMEARNTATGIGANIVKTALMVARNGGMGMNGKHCWDWSCKVYRMAGVPMRGKYPAMSNVFSYRKTYTGRDCKANGGGPGRTYATDAQYDRIQPGDWLYYNNRNNSDTYGNHSAVFIEWIDKDRKLARMASGSHGIPWRVHTSPTNFNNMPVINVSRAKASGGPLPDVAAIEEKYRQDRLPPTVA